MSEKAKEILRMDLYALLGVESTATPKQIKKAYRQKALACHPDKNPDNPKAADLFHQLSQALELLIDAAARAAYDKTCAAKRQAEERNRKLDDKRKKFKFDLEAREHEHKRQEEEKITRDQEEREITRLREEGCRLLEEEQQRYRDREKEAQRLATAGSTQTAGRCSKSNVTPKLKLKWKCRKDDDTNGGYSQDVLFRLLYKYGDILNVLVSSKKKGSAVVEFATVQGAERAVKYETGLNGNPLKISWIEGEPEVASTQGPLGSERDFESLVLMRMRQAAERQKLIEEMQKEDEEAGGAKS